MLKTDWNDFHALNRSAARKSAALDNAGKAAARLVRIVTTSPFMAAALVLILHHNIPGALHSPLHVALSILGLSVLPLIGYPLSRVLPPFKGKGRQGERSLTIILSVAGYALCAVMAFGFNDAPIEKCVIVTYLISGALIALSSFLLHFRASGHACGVCGPIAALTLLVSPWYLLGGVLVWAVCRASLSLKRHTLPELVAGAAYSVVSLLIAATALGIWP